MNDNKQTNDKEICRMCGKERKLYQLGMCGECLIPSFQQARQVINHWRVFSVRPDLLCHKAEANRG